MPIQIGEKPSPTFAEPLELLSDCHRRVELFLKTLLLVAEQARGGKLDGRQREGLETALRYFREAAPKHTADEEESLFPRMRARGAAAEDALERIRVLEQDHRAAGVHHALVEDLGKRWLAGDRLGDVDLAQFRFALDQLSNIYREHIAIEDNEVFPIAGRVLSAAELKEVGREMAARRGQNAERMFKR